MDESAYRDALKSSIPLPCPFEKAILTRCAECSKSEKHNIAEREAVACNSVETQQGCSDLHESLKHNFKFALGKAHLEGPLPHAQEMRIQCGGLKGLQYALDGNELVADISALLNFTLKKFGRLDGIPYTQIIRYATTHYKPR